jgi:putative Mn2+ efflux pump MntP
MFLLAVEMNMDGRLVAALHGTTLQKRASFKILPAALTSAGNSGS